MFPVRAGALLVAALSCLAPAVLPAQAPDDTLRATPRLRFWVLVPAALDVTGRPGAPLTPAPAGQAWAERVRALAERRRRERFQEHLLLRVGLSRDTGAVAAEAPPAIPRPEDMIRERAAGAADPLEALAGYADLGLDATAHIEMKVDRLRNARCAPGDVTNPASGCRETGFPTPSFDQQFRLRAGGIMADRLNVNVDFDSEREFDANNNINVWYQGLGREILRRVDVGTVTLRTPPSRFITAAIPSNSFGVQAEAQLGPLELRTIAAQQKGSALRTRMFTIGEVTTQPVRVELRDVDFESGRFFFVVNPRAIPGYPAIDPLDLAPERLPAAVRPLEVRVYRLQAQTGRAQDNPNLGGITAVALRTDSPQRVGPLPWELLIEGRDYYLDPSGLWFALARRLGPEEVLAVSYVTMAGDTVGTLPAMDRGADTLELVFEPRRGPETPTFHYEMRNWYRVGGADVARPTIDLAVLLNESERPLGGQGTYLARLGLAQTSDPSLVDEYNRVFPRQRDPDGGAPIRDLFVAFPHLTPFADTARLTAAERSDSLYRTPTYLLATEGPPARFHLRVAYQAAGAGDRSAVSLGALQVREGSERIYAGDRLLVRGQDYDIDYAVGQVRFTNPDSLFVGPTQIRAEFEEHQLFDVAPKSIVGMTGTYHLSPTARLHAIAMYQRDRTPFTRPLLGFEPQSHFIGGMSTELEFRPLSVTRLLDALPFIETSVPSRLAINGEVAMSQPNPNQVGVAFVEDFQGEAARLISLLERDFQLGSAPFDARGVPLSHLGLGGIFRPEDAVPLVWQNVVVGADAGVVEFRPQDIDSTIVLTGQGVQIEPVLWLTLKADTVGGAPDPATGAPRWTVPHTPGPRWRSVTQPLGGGSGADLSRMEFLEFWVLEDAAQTARRQQTILLFDFGTVFEDAVAKAPREFQPVGGDTVFTGVRLVGEGRLDTEKDTLTNVFNAMTDDVGIHGDRVDSIVNAATGELVHGLALCDLRGATRVPVFPRGHLAATCTRRNTRLDTEDLDGDNRLDRDVGVLNEEVFRYVVPVGDPRYVVRDGVTFVDAAGRPHTWRLYRVPFRTDAVEVGRPNMRRIGAVRLTIVVPDQGGAANEAEVFVALARLRLLGAPWLKRAPTPIAGLSGADGEPHGEVAASVISTENRDLGYTSPPGVGNDIERQGQNLELVASQINERALRLLAADLRAGERAEAYIRFADEADRNFLGYRELRVWGRGRGPGWDEGDLEFFVKVGRDEHNFYLYRVPLRTESWEPEVVIDLDRWLALRAEVERRWLAGEPPAPAAACGADSTAYVACDGAYLVQVRDPAVAPPNLARVAELSVGMYRGRASVTVPQAELWVNDIRLTGVVDDVGVAAAFDATLSAADVAELSVSVSSRDDRFRQLGQDPTYVTDRSARLASVVRLNKFLPEGVGLDIPLVVQYQRGSAAPFYLQRTDVRADALRNVRQPRTDQTSVEFSLRRQRRGASVLTRTLVDPLSVRLRRASGEHVTSMSRASTSTRYAGIGYNLLPGAVTTAGAPGFLRAVVAELPAWLRDSEFGRALRTSRLRVNPFQVRLSSALSRTVTDRFTYRVPVERDADTLLAPFRGVAHTWQTQAEAELRPYQSLSFRVTHVSTRDLYDYGDSTTVHRLLNGERRRLLGADVGFERARRLTTVLHMSPAVSSWLRPRLSIVTQFGVTRDPNAAVPVRVGSDSGALKAPEALTNRRRRELGSSIDVGRLWRGLAGDSGLAGIVARAVLPADIAVSLERGSTFDRAAFDADFAYHMGAGGRDAFRFQEGVAATAATEVREVALTGGMRLPLGGTVRVTYRELDHLLWSRRGEGQAEVAQHGREWPSFTVSWAYAPRWALRRFVSNLTAHVRWHEETRETVRPWLGTATGPAVRTHTATSTVAPSVTVSWVGGVSTTGRLTVATSDLITAGNLTHSERVEWGGAMHFAFRAPRGLVRLREAIQANLAYNASKTAVCLQRVRSDECRTVSDSRRHQLDLRLDTGLSELLRGGSTLTYVLSDQRHTSSRLTQVVFTIFADISLFAGQLR